MSQSAPPSVVIPPAPEQRIIDVLKANIGKPLSISDLFCKVPPNTSMPVLLKALARLQVLRQIQMDDVGFWTLVPRSQVPFSEVCEGEAFELPSYRGRKLSGNVSQNFGDRQAHFGNVAIIEVLPGSSEADFNLGSVGRVDNDTVVTVYRQAKSPQ
ncbi:MAG TPA: hypothetical protein VGE35_01955 [Candidatus Paceibacterota bacterium]